MTTRGSGQGCRFGSVIFNGVYGVTLFELLAYVVQSWLTCTSLEAPK